MKIGHISDLHLGIDNYGRINPETGLNSRFVDFFETLEFCLKTCVETKVDIVLFGGDIFKNSFPSPTTQKMFAEKISLLLKNEIPLIILTGNHDAPISFGKSSPIELYESLGLSTIKVVSKPEKLRMKTKSGELQLLCLPWPTTSNFRTKEEAKSISREEIAQEVVKRCNAWLTQQSELLDKTLPSVVLAHVNIASAIFSGTEKRALITPDPTFETSDFRLEGIDYVALGHVHKFQNLNENYEIPIVYPGSIERIDFGEEKNEKGFVIAEITEKGKTEFEFIPTNARKFLTIKIDVTDSENPMEQIEKELKSEKITDKILRVILKLKKSDETAIDKQKIDKLLQKAFYLAKIEFVTEEEKRRRRIFVTKDESLQDSVKKYLRKREDLSKHQDKILEKVDDLESRISEE